MSEQTNPAGGFWDDVPIIHSYTRAEALADGALIDVTETAKEAGFSVPVAVTSAVWADCIKWTDADSERQTHQDEAGRLWDVVFMTMWAAKRAPRGDTVAVELYRVPRGGTGKQARLVRLVAKIGPGDKGEPVLTIMQPDED